MGLAGENRAGGIASSDVPVTRSADLARALGAEFLGSLLLVAVVVGSGIMAERLAGGDAAMALLANSLATAMALPVLILVFGPVSGAHFNPAVTLALALRGESRPGRAVATIACQLVGAIAGTLLAHAMFDLDLLQQGVKARGGTGAWISEAVATAGLLLVVFGCRARHAAAAPYAIGLYIGAGYWFTASTCFANPAVAVARSLTATFTGIAPADLPGFILAELGGAGLGLALAVLLFAGDPSRRR